MKRCLQAGCSRLTSSGPRCVEHQRAFYRRRQVTRDQYPVKVYGSAEWKAIAAAVLRDAIDCHWCHATNEKLTADHVQPITFYPSRALDPSNVVASCRSCQTHRSWETGARDR